MFEIITRITAACSNSSFFGLVPWYKYLDTNDKCEIQSFTILPKGGNASDIPYLLLAGVDNLLRIGGLVAVMFIIYAGILYATSQGNADQTAKHRAPLLMLLPVL